MQTHTHTYTHTHTHKPHMHMHTCLQMRVCVCVSISVLSDRTLTQGLTVSDTPLTPITSYYHPIARYHGCRITLPKLTEHSAAVCQAPNPPPPHSLNNQCVCPHNASHRSTSVAAATRPQTQLTQRRSESTSIDPIQRRAHGSD